MLYDLIEIKNYKNIFLREFFRVLYLGEIALKFFRFEYNLDKSISLNFLFEINFGFMSKFLLPSIIF